MQWSEFRKLVEQTVEGLRAAQSDRDKVESAIRHYLTRGDALGMSPTILWDYFAISSPSIPQRAGYDRDEADEMVTVFERTSTAFFGKR